jgi:hypothetical protein
MEPLEGEGRPGAEAQGTFQSSPVGGLDADAAVETEPAAVIPGEHVLGIVGLQKAVAPKTPQDPGTDRVLEGLQEFLDEGCGLVEAEVGSWAGSRTWSW